MESPVTSIRPLTATTYQVGIAQPGSVMLIECEVAEDQGISYMIPRPDVFIGSTLDVRAVATQVIAYHEERTQEQASDG